MSNTFMYFAYGSNMLGRRIRMNNPSAVRRDIACLKNFRLDFLTYSKRWRGCSATIVPTENSVVWGTVWEIDTSTLSALDTQEGVPDKIYFAHMVDVETPSGKVLNCRVYQQYNTPKEHIEPCLLPKDRRPSPFYIETIINGAKESKIPIDYIKFLEAIPHNGYSGDYDIR